MNLGLKKKESSIHRGLSPQTSRHVLSVSAAALTLPEAAVATGWGPKLTYLLSAAPERRRGNVWCGCVKRHSLLKTKERPSSHEGWALQMAPMSSELITTKDSVITAIISSSNNLNPTRLPTKSQAKKSKYKPITQDYLCPKESHFYLLSMHRYLPY